MTKDDIQLLYEYDRWANHRVLHAAPTLVDTSSQHSNTDIR